jgi:mono/diheme cytochrome c family protein
MSQPVQPAPRATGPGETSPRGAVVPVWLIVLMVVMLYLGALYFDDHGGWFSEKVYAPYHSYAEVVELQPVTGNDPLAAGFKIYNKPTCVSCHQASGLGAPGQFPPLAGSDWVNEAEPGRIIRAVLNGLQGPITVKGSQFNNAMVPWNILSDQEIADVLTYVRQNKEWGNNAPPVTAARVKAVREKIKSHPSAFTADELLKVSPAD